MSPKRPSKRYWDSCAFLGFLAPEADKLEDCRTVIKAAQANRVRIVTSALTLTEVVKLKRHARLTKESERKIREFFKHEYVVLVELDRRIGEQARQLLWQHQVLDPKDAVHVATALYAQVDVMDTFDKPLMKLSGTMGNPALTIGRPSLPEQLEIGYGEGAEEEPVSEDEDDDTVEEE